MSIITSLEQYNNCLNPDVVTQIIIKNDEELLSLDEIINKFKNLTCIITNFIQLNDFNIINDICDRLTTINCILINMFYSIKIIKNEKLQINIIHVKDDFQQDLLLNLPNNLNILNISNFITESLFIILSKNLPMCLEEINIMVINKKYDEKHYTIQNIKKPFRCDIRMYYFENSSDIYNYLLGNKIMPLHSNLCDIIN